MKFIGRAIDRVVVIKEKGKGDRMLNPVPSQRLVNHSPDGFNWGYGGSGPTQLALAILLEIYGEEFAMHNYHKFKWEVIAEMEQGKDFEIDLKKIREWSVGNQVTI